MLQFWIFSKISVIVPKIMHHVFWAIYAIYWIFFLIRIFIFQSSLIRRPLDSIFLDHLHCISYSLVLTLNRANSRRSKKYAPNHRTINKKRKAMSKIRSESKSILLFVDNCTSHKIPEDVSLTNVKLAYFPKNSASVLQPLDGGLIHSFKANYKKPSPLQS